MENFLLKLFNIKKIPAKLIFVIWLSASLILFVPEYFLTKLNLKDFLKDYGKYIGVSFIISSGFLIVIIFNFIFEIIASKRFNKKVKINILRDINNLNFHEKALLREFYINGKNTLQLPIDNDTVVGLANKHIIYRASNTGFTYIHGAYFPFSITDFAKNNMTFKMLDLPQNPTEEDKRRIIDTRPNWAKERSQFDN